MWVIIDRFQLIGKRVHHSNVIMNYSQTFSLHNISVPLKLALTHLHPVFMLAFRLKLYLFLFEWHHRQGINTCVNQCID